MHTMDRRGGCHITTTSSPLGLLVGRQPSFLWCSISVYTDHHIRSLNRHLHQPNMGDQNPDALDLVQASWRLHLSP